MSMLRRRAALLAIAIATSTTRSSAQSQYYDTDAGRPLRIEDATATELRGLALYLPNVRLERLDGGIDRWRTEPGISYGFAPRTAFDARASFVEREPGTHPRGGLTGVGFSVQHALAVETLGLPAIAFAGELYLPAGSAGGGDPAVSFRSLLTKTTELGRFHANATIGTYNVVVVRPTTETCVTAGFPVRTTTCGANLPLLPDGPCDIASGGGPSVSARCAAPPEDGQSLASTARGSTTAPTRGTHWVIGVGGDHAFALRSLLLMADVYAERYVGLYALTEWTGEVGVRQQLTPTLVLDAGVGRRFAGITRAWMVNLGATRTVPFGPLLRFRPGGT